MENNTENNQLLTDGEESGSGFATALRFIGSFLLLAGAITYLVEGWYEVGHISRYLKFLGVTSLLSLVGIATSVFLGEQRGARTFLGLAVIAVPINFCQLGALLYSVMPFKSVPDDITQYLLWEASSLSAGLTVTGIGLVTLSAITWLSFSVLGRQGRNLLFPSVLGLNALLLLPVRGAFPVGALTVVAALVALTISKKLSALPAFRYTFEGWFCRLLLWVPSSILLLRTAVIYDRSEAIFGIFCLYTGFLTLLGSRLLNEKNDFIPFLEFTAAAVIMTGVVSEVSVIMEVFSLPGNYGLPVVSFAIIFFVQTITSYLKRSADAVRSVGLLIACLLSLGVTLDNQGVYPELLATAASALVVYIGSRSNSRHIVFTGAMTFLAGSITLLMEIVPDLFSSWLTLSLLGVVVVFAGSLVEKKLVSLLPAKGKN